MTVVHLGVAGELVSRDRHCVSHVLGTTLEEVAATSRKDRVAGKQQAIYGTSHLIALGDLISRMLHALHGLIHSLKRLKKVEHVATGVTWCVKASDLDTISLDDLFMLEACCGTWNIIGCTTENLNIREHLLHLHIALRVIVMLVSSQDMRRLHSDSHGIHELADFLRFCDINQDSRLCRQVSRHVVAEIPHVIKHVNDVHFHLKNSNILEQ